MLVCTHNEHIVYVLRSWIVESNDVENIVFGKNKGRKNGRNWICYVLYVYLFTAYVPIVLDV